MSHRIIIEIDQHELRVLAARVAGPRIQVQHALRISVERDGDWSQTVERCAQQLTQHHIGRGDADVIISRRSVEMREIKVPPAPDEELPDLLRFIAKNEFAAVNEQWRLDFVPLSDDATVGRTVIAAALSPQWLTQIEQLGERCGLKLKRILLRPFLDALIVAAHHPLAEGVSLLVHRVGETVDLTLIQQARVLLSRSVLLAGHDPAALDLETAQEIRRAVLSAPRVGTGRAVDRVLLVGREADSAGVRQHLADLGTAELVACDPLAGGKIQLGRELGAIAQPEQFAAHLGALHALAGSPVPQIDFINPRRKVVKQLDKRRLALWAAALGIFLIGSALLIWQTLSSQQRTIAQLEKDLAKLIKDNAGDRLRPGVDDVIGEVRLIDQWMRSRVDFTQEFSEISRRLKTADETILDVFSANLIRNDELRITLSGQANSRDSAFAIQQQLSDRPYEVKPGSVRMDSKYPEYPFSYSAELSFDLTALNYAQWVNDQIVKEASAGSKVSSDTPLAIESGAVPPAGSQ